MHITRCVLAGLTAISLFLAVPRAASSADASGAVASGQLQEVVVTARKRKETLTSVPITMTAIGRNELQNRGITSLDDVAQIVPQLMIGNQSGSVQGGNIVMRGIQGPDSNPFGDQAVAFNIDGVSIAKSWVRRMGLFDLDQVQVLEGPQALYYGKNSPGGVVILDTVEPTDHFEAGTTESYEVQARQWRTDDYVSGPLTDGLSGRLAMYYLTEQGWLVDNTPPDTTYAPYNSRNPEGKEWAMRGTLKWDRWDRFNAQLMFSYGVTNNNGPGATAQFVSCPYGVRQTGSGLPCGIDGTSTNSGYGSYIATIPGTLNYFRSDGQNFEYQNQMLTSLRMNYMPSAAYTVTSITGFYRMQLWQCQNYEQDPSILLPSCNTPTNDRQLSEDLRLTTSLDDPLNFFGGLYTSLERAQTGSLTYLYGGDFDLLGPGLGGPTTPAIVDDYFLTEDDRSYSAYLQAIYNPIKTVEIDVGGRESYEEKSVPQVWDGGGLSEGCYLVAGVTCTTILTPADAVNVDPSRVVWHNFSPEYTISYRPTGDLTVFGSWKEGFMSGGFNSSSVNYRLEPDISYQPEIVKGFEGGIKSMLLDRTLALNVSLYKYDVTDLQVTNFQNATSTIRNAGAVEIRGAEVQLDYLTPLKGLQLHGEESYNDGVYTSFPNAPCYNGQTIAMGCNGDFSGGVYNSQDLSGTPLIRSPKWTLSAGSSYDRAVGDALELGFTVDADYTSSYLTDDTSAPQSLEPAYTLIDASVRLGNPDRGWQLAFIGHDLTNRYYFVAAPNVPFTGSGTGTAGPSVLGDRFAALSGGREYQFQVSYKFGAE